MAWHEGKPEYRSSPNSKEVRENFAYLKAIADILSGAGVTQADLVALRGASSAPGANKIAKYDSNGILQGASLDATGEQSTTGNTSETAIDVGTVTAGDRIYVEAHVGISDGTANGEGRLRVGKSSGTASVTFVNGLATPEDNHPLYADGWGYYHITTVCRVIISGTLVLKTIAYGEGASVSYTGNMIYIFFLKKQ